MAFLRTVTRNRALDFVKERNRWAPSDALDQSDESTMGRVGGPGPRDAAFGVADDECLAFLRQEVGRLKREDRELYLMKARGLKEREIAEQTGRSAGTVASQIARLLERLRERLRDRGCV